MDQEDQPSDNPNEWTTIALAVLSSANAGTVLYILFLVFHSTYPLGHTLLRPLKPSSAVKTLNNTVKATIVRYQAHQGMLGDTAGFDGGSESPVMSRLWIDYGIDYGDRLWIPLPLHNKSPLKVTGSLWWSESKSIMARLWVHNRVHNRSHNRPIIDNSDSPYYFLALPSLNNSTRLRIEALTLKEKHFQAHQRLSLTIVSFWVRYVNDGRNIWVTARGYQREIDRLKGELKMAVFQAKKVLVTRGVPNSQDRSERSSANNSEHSASMVAAKFQLSTKGMSSRTIHLDPEDAEIFQLEDDPATAAVDLLIAFRKFQDDRDKLSEVVKVSKN
ncbi:hypothetical protein EV421DRAFT_1740095 [Armillaria borealis]|uniref:Uncharacterized protein n=1 Tax=Armillaria borealis TaxID=47425 RepID=A0AA39MJF3_9AGAR|nr:hypothetical protein EV421DRAFT_1740095 [Armillaria borealis]